MNNREKLWYLQPAKEWVEALPIGNGRLGGMVFGHVQEERIQLNEDSIWYGGPKDGLNPDGSRNLEHIRELLFAGKVEEATRLTRMALFSTPKYYNPYQPLGDLRFYFHGHQGEVEGYRRELDIKNATARTSYRVDGVTYHRTMYASYPDQVIVMRLECDQRGKLAFSANLNRRPYEGESGRLSADSIWMSGDCGKHGVDYACVLKARTEDGSVSVVGDFLSVEGASSVTLLLAAASTFREPDPLAACQEHIASAEAYRTKELESRHIHDYQALYNRISLRLAEQDPLDDVATDQRLKLLHESHSHVDIGLTELYFHYGRYLLIASSRPGCLPANLQGIWNDSFTPPWESKYTININTQMNYWPAEVCGLSECHEPLFDHIEHMQVSGRQTARELYGCSGFVAHHNTNIWGETRPEGLFPTCVIWPMGAAWLSLHLWEQFLFTADQDFLRRRAYPILKEAAAFFVNYLVESPNGQLVTGPSVSPENLYVLADGTRGALTMGPSMDSQIIHELFTACIQSCDHLQVDGELRAQLTSLLERLPKPQIGRHGQIMEWLEDYEEVDPGHRHISQLFALHPGTQISPHRTPELAEAAAATLQRRLDNGGGHTGWSSAWIVNMYARLEDGEQAYTHLSHMLSKSTYPNLFDAHPPFQIDGNFGATAGIVEMLLQTHAGELSLLPALPTAWQQGTVSGLRGRNGYVIDLTWNDGQLSQAVIRAALSGSCRVRTREAVLVFCDGKEVLANRDQTVIEFQVEAGCKYEIFRK
ncbi:glycoside hydrolase family 95 protein [Paenibacillus qinlingensis]|uniref:Alpha-L-fucosidase 2 n=1 Tax=Paenibacillus qinlingensis TaxID=1837343 RepID=A0ABU1P0J1_9BACL|nr:glycoside hydrolase family 95 protein [Paenibacillus qinlingensis]MDR6553094.1 alpha-L-fucosidase 2 [Paenibacillus qinlingensis]